MNITLIQDRDQYETYLLCLDEMMSIENPSKSEQVEIEHLGLVIEHYENSQFWQPPLLHPIDAIKYRMAQLGLKQKDMGEYLGAKSKVSEVLNRKRPLSLEMIRKLHFRLGIPAEALLQGYPTP